MVTAFQHCHAASTTPAGKPEQVFANLRLSLLTTEFAAVVSSQCMYFIWELVYAPLAAVGCCVPAILSQSVRCFVF